MEPSPSFEYINTFANKADNPLGSLMNGGTKKRSRDEAFGSMQARFQCPCQAEVATGDIQDHRQRCDKMAEKYGQLYDAWRASMQSAVDTEDPDEWRNMRALYEHFRTDFIEGIEQQRLKRRKVIVEVNLEEEKMEVDNA